MNDRRSQRDEELARRLRDLAPIYSKPRRRESLYIFLFILIALAHLTGILEKNDPSQKLIEERSLVSCERAVANAERYAEVIAVAANGGQFRIADDLISCRRK